MKRYNYIHEICLVSCKYTRVGRGQTRKKNASLKSYDKNTN